MTNGIRKTHDFCWINVMTPKATEARTFFGDLLGWSFDEMPGVPSGKLIRVGGASAGALMDLESGGFPPGTPPAIGVLVKVDEVDAAVTKVESLGGRAEAPMDVLENGRMALCTDPTGAIFGLWEPKKQKGMDVDSHAHGAPGWYEVLTKDAARAATFYAELFGWEVEEQRPQPDMLYRLFKLDGVPVAGAMELDEAMGNVPAHWAVSFSVRNADETARRVTELGGELCIPVGEIPGVGRFSLLKSPQGVSFHITEWRD